MKVIIKETHETNELSIIDPKTGLNWAKDFIGNAGAIVDGYFVWDDEACAYLCSKSDYEGWSTTLADHESLDNRIYALKQKHGSEIVDRALLNMGMDHEPSKVNRALDDAFGPNE